MHRGNMVDYYSIGTGYTKVGPVLLHRCRKKCGIKRFAVVTTKARWCLYWGHENPRSRRLLSLERQGSDYSCKVYF